MKWTLADALARLPLPATPKWRLGVFDVEVWRRGPVSLTLFAPQGEDFQTPHDQDELYLCVAGRARFTQAGEAPVDVTVGDVLFVAAGVEHRFSEMADGFALWVVFL